MDEPGRLRWMCRRGMKELDILLLRYLDRHYPLAQPAARRAFIRLLEMQDPDLYSLLLGRGSTADREISNVIAILRQSPD